MSTNFPSNSHKSKASKDDKKVVEKVVTGSAKQRKKPLSRKVAETFVAEDVQSVGQHIMFDVLVPAAKSMIEDAVREGLARMLHGESRRKTTGQHRGNQYIPYNRTSSTATGRSMSRKARATHDFDEVVLDSRGEAEEVLDRLGDLVDQYGMATVSDLYDLVGITGNFTDDKWGWFNLGGASVARVSDGYLLNLPKTTSLD